MGIQGRQEKRGKAGAVKSTAPLTAQHIGEPNHKRPAVANRMAVNAHSRRQFSRARTATERAAVPKAEPAHAASRAPPSPTPPPLLCRLRRPRRPHTAHSPHVQFLSPSGPPLSACVFPFQSHVYYQSQGAPYHHAFPFSTYSHHM
jgi:hypothetical protein